jgi:hypothetical protein
MRVVTLLGVLTMGMVLATGGILGGIGCGGNAVSENEAGGGGSGGSAGKGGGGSMGTGGGGSMGKGGGGSMGTGGSNGSGGSKGSGGTKGSPTDGGTGFETSTCSGGIACCPDTPCTTGDVCCANVKAAEAGAAFTCTMDCAPADTLGCTAPSDCTGTDNICCVTAVLSGGGTPPGCLATSIQSVASSCTTGTACPSDIHLTNACMNTDTVRMCSSSADCTESGYPDCCELPLGGRIYAACVTTTIKGLITAFDPSLKCN